MMAKKKFLIIPVSCRNVLLLLLFTVLILSGNISTSSPALSSQLFISSQMHSAPLLPYLDYYLDEGESLDIEEIAAGKFEFKALEPEKLPRTEGVMWLRFTIAQTASDRPVTSLLDMGQSVPGTPFLYEPVLNVLSGVQEWSESAPMQRNIFLLPEAGAQPKTCYIRLGGLPGLWFAPTVRSPQDAATNWGSLFRSGAILALGVVLLLCLLRGLSEKGQWRYWTALYVGFALCQEVIGLPAPADALGFWGTMALLSPGIALMLLPHVGRHLLGSATRSRCIDIQLLLLSFFGAALALLPLFPGWTWLDRWLELWPACIILLVPTAVGAWLAGLPGSRRFLLGCLIPPLFVAFGAYGLDFGLPANILSSAPLWGICLSALLLTAAKPPEYDEARCFPEQETGNGENLFPEPEDSGNSAAIINLDHPLADDTLNLLPSPNPDKIPDPFIDSKPMEQSGAANAKSGHPVLAMQKKLAERELILRSLLETLLGTGAALGKCSLAPVARKHAEGMIAAAKNMADVISGNTSLPEAGNSGQKEEIFNLGILIKRAHDYVSGLGISDDISFAWYMQPDMGQIYKGNAELLLETLTALLESSVRATHRGEVQLSAKKSPAEDASEHILFTITDTGTGSPHYERSGLALAKVLELTGIYKGHAKAEFHPGGAVIKFTLRLTPAREEDKNYEENKDHIVVASDNARERHELAKILRSEAFRLSEAAGPKEIMRIQSSDPAGLLITGGRMAMPSAADTIFQFIDFAHAAGFEVCKILAITEDDTQWSFLAQSGFTHAMTKPLEAAIICKTAHELMEMVKSAYSPIKKPGDEAFQENDKGMSSSDTDTSGQSQNAPADEKPAGFVQDENVQREDFPENSGGDTASPDPEKSVISGHDELLNDSGGGNQTAETEEKDALSTNNAEEYLFADVVESPENIEEIAAPPHKNAGNVEPAGVEENGAESPAPIEDVSMTEKVTEDKADSGHEKNQARDEIDMDIVSATSGLPAEKQAKRDGGGKSSRLKSIYVSPSLSSPGEWVGQPMPIGTPVMQKNVKPGDARAKDTAEKISRENHLVQPSYRSPSMADADEWVGEPMPVRQAVGNNNGEKTDAEQKDGMGREKEKFSSDSLVDFIVDVNPHNAEMEETANPVPDVHDGEEKAAAGKNSLPAGDPILELVSRLDSGIKAANTAFASGEFKKVAREAAEIANDAESFGLRVLSRMARCVERAGIAGDNGALKDLLPELTVAIERNRIALTQKK